MLIKFININVGLIAGGFALWATQEHLKKRYWKLKTHTLPAVIPLEPHGSATVDTATPCGVATVTWKSSSLEQGPEQSQLFVMQVCVCWLQFHCFF